MGDKMNDSDVGLKFLVERKSSKMFNNVKRPSMGVNKDCWRGLVGAHVFHPLHELASPW